MKIVLFASPGILGPFILGTLIQLKEQVVQLVLPNSQYSASVGELLAIAKHGNVPTFQPQHLKSSSCVDQIRNCNPDLIVVATFDKKIPKEIINIPSKGAINIHPSLLPLYRGACPEFWAMKNNEEKTGITIHHLSDEFDTGRIIAQEVTPIYSDDTIGVLLYRLATTAGRMVLKLLPEIKKNGLPEGVMQEEAYATCAPLIQDGDLRVKWNSTVQEICNTIRAGNPVGGAWTTFRGFQMKIWHVVAGQITLDKVPLHIKKTPGTIYFDVNHQKVCVIAGDGIVELKVVQQALYYILDGWSFREKALVKEGEELL